MAASAPLASHFLVVGVDEEHDKADTPLDALAADVVARFPLTDKDACTPCPEAVHVFAMPEGVETVTAASPAARAVQFFAYVLTDIDGHRSYAHCLSFFQPLRGHPGAWARRRAGLRIRPPRPRPIPPRPPRRPLRQSRAGPHL
jgi:hypothetical protein